MAASSSSSSPTTATATDNQKYDVFLSFRGVDTRSKFMSHLYDALDRKKIPTYMDDMSLERGDDIGPALSKAIEQSRLSIIIFSKEYASSPWCLNELLHILETKETCGHFVIPVFYETDPAHVRRQAGTYGSAFAKHEERYDTDRVSKWRNALTTAANLSGFDSRNFRADADLIKNLTDVILLKLDLKGLVGAEGRIEKIESLLSIQDVHTQDVLFRSVGIWGTDGIGKTTLTEAIFHRHSHKFEACCFLANITERSDKYGPEHLKNKLLCDLLKEDYSSIKDPSIDSILDKKLSLTKVLIVLDDVSSSDQLKGLLLDQVQFGAGSRIIITSRNLEALLGLVDHKYEVEKLKPSESHLLFRSIAFEDHKSLSSEYSDWSNTVVVYSQGIPLALKVLGSLFRECNTRRRWIQELECLENMSNREIKDVLRLRYDRLQEKDKKIFLDIACFLKGKKIRDAEKMLKMNELDPQGIGNLRSAHLISISKEKHLNIHYLVEELGKNIAREGAPATWSRVWEFSVLENCPGPLAVEALFLDISDIHKRQLIGEALFKRMPKLRLLKFYVPRESYETFGEKKGLDVTLNYSSIKKELPSAKTLKDQCKTTYKCHIGGLDSLPELLTYLHWDGYPFKYLPKYYSPDNLIELHLPYSRLENLLKPKTPVVDALKVKNYAFPKKLPNKPLKLEVINLRYSKNLIEVPDLSWCPGVERLDLSGCISLLNLKYSNGDNKIQISLKELLLCWCINLEFVPDSIYKFSLDTLDLRGCRKLKKLPSSSGKQYFSSLRRLNLSWCDKLKIHDDLICLPTLEEICLSGTMIENIPAGIKKSSKLRKLVVKNCPKLQYLPEFPPLLEILEADGCTSLKSVAPSNNNALVQDGAPDCSALEKLMLTKSLDQSHTNELLEDVDRERLMFTKSLDQSLKNELLEYAAHVNEKSATSFSVSLSRSDEFHLQAKGRSRGPRFQSNYGSPAPWLGERRIFTNCFKLEESTKIKIIEDTQFRIQRIASSKHEYGTVFATCPGDNIPPWFSHREEGCSINVQCPQPDDETLSGFAVSVVFATQNEGLNYLFQLRCDCKLKTDDREVYEFLQFESPLVLSMKNSDSSHDTSGSLDNNVLVFYQKDMFRRSLPLDKVTSGSFSFSLQCSYGGDDDQIKVRVRRVRVKNCGIKMLYA